MSKKNVNNIDRIRDIIFGSEMKAFEKKFVHLEAAIEEIDERVEALLDEFYGLRNSIEKEFGSIHKSVEKKIDTLVAATHKEQAKLKKKIAASNTDLQQQLKDQKNKFGAKLKAVKESIATDKVESTFRMKKMISEIERSLQQDIKSLHEEQLSRENMAQILLAMAEELQNNSLSLSAKRKETN